MTVHTGALRCISIVWNATDNFQCNSQCTEPTNFAFIPMDGIPTGPPGPASQYQCLVHPKQADLAHESRGDQLEITIKDTADGLLNRIDDKTTGKSGYMVASASNGFQSLHLSDCSPVNYTFRPEYATAKFGNFVPWAALQANARLRGRDR